MNGLRLSLIKYPSGGSGGGGVNSVGLSLPSDVFTVSGSPVTNTGTLTGVFKSQIQNLVFASPNGSSGLPSFRALSYVDIGDLPIIAADNGLSYASGNTVVLGQLVGNSGNPGKLLFNTEIPLNNHFLQITGFGDSYIQFPTTTTSFSIYQGTSTLIPITIYTNQGINPGSNPYGNFYFTLNQAFTNPDGQIDSVYSWGYNNNGDDGRQNLNEAAFATVLESHYQQAGIGHGTFEWYLTSQAKNGTISRHTFMVIDKEVGSGYMTFQLDQMQWYQTTALGTNNYCNIGPGKVDFLGLTDATETVRIANNQADLRFIATNDNSGSITVLNNGGLHYQGNAGIIFQVPAPFNGYDFIFLSGDTNPNHLFDIMNHTSISKFSVIASTGHILINKDTYAGASDSGDDLQVAGTVLIGTTTSTQVVSSILQLVSTTQGFLPPVMTTTQKLAIVSPAEGLQVYDLTLHQLSYFNGTTWVNV